MRIVCPRCESPNSKSVNKCVACSYPFRVGCPACSAKNVIGARFCGSCGEGLGVATRLRSKWEQLVSFRSRLKLKNFSIGFALGGLISIFAFGSVGMNATQQNFSAQSMPGSLPPIQAEKYSAHLPAYSAQDLGFVLPEAVKSFDLAKAWLASDSPWANATFQDILMLGRLVLYPFTKLTEQTPGELDTSSFLPVPENYSPENGHRPIDRSTMTLFFFKLVQNGLKVTPPPPPATTRQDIPRFHFMNLPIFTLTSVGLDVCRNEKYFGAKDNISRAELFEIVIRAISLAEARTKIVAFAPIPPSSTLF